MSEALGVATQETETGVTPGALLRRERERRALSVQQTAEDLHLDPWVVEAIESDRFQALGAPVYAKGHLRKYAARLGLPVEDIIARYEALQDRPVETDPIPAAVAAPVTPPRRSLRLPIRIAAVLLAVGGIAWIAMQMLPSVSGLLRPGAEKDVTAATMPEAVMAAADSQASPPDAQSASEQNATSSSVLSIEEPAASSAAPSTASVAEPAPPTVTGEAIRVRLEFSGESWTEVVDAGGQRLMFAMGSPGRISTLTGVPPLHVTLGAASAVSVHVNGSPVVIPQRDGRDSARFVIDADGTLR